jgi:hypothetical protein
LKTTGLWSNDTVGTDIGAEIVHPFASERSSTLGCPRVGKWVGYSGCSILTACAIQ